MRLYAIWGQDCIFEGLHGMKNIAVVEVDMEEDALNLARDLAVEVADTYDEIYEQLRTDFQDLCDFNNIDENSEEGEELWEEVFNEDLSYGCIELDASKCKDFTIKELEDMYYNYEDEFLEKYRINF